MTRAFFFFQEEDGIGDYDVTVVQTGALPISVLMHQPNHPIAKKALRKLQKGLPQNQSVETETSSPSQDQINSLVNLYQSGQMTKTEQACRELLKPRSEERRVGKEGRSRWSPYH